MKKRSFLAAVALAVFLACAPAEDEAKKLGTKAVVIGIDSADWRIIEQLAADGGMPNLMALRERGAGGDIATLNDVPLSPVIWTSVATGKTAAKHGISWFLVDQPDGSRVPVRSHNRKVKAIWNLLAEQDRQAAVVGWWATYPAEDIGGGTIVSDGMGFHGFGSTANRDTEEGKAYPAESFARLDSMIPPEQQISYEFASRFLNLSEDEWRNEQFDPARYPQRNVANPIHLFQMYAVTAEGYTRIAEDLLDRDDVDLQMIYYEQVDSFAHLFMKYAEPKLPWVEDEPFERYKNTVFEWYRYQDELLGRLLAKIDLEETAVFIVSDHGFKSGDRRIRSETTVDASRAHMEHEPEGVFLAAGPHIKQGTSVRGASVLDVTPTLLHYLGFPVAKDMDGKVLEGIFEDSFRSDHPIRYVVTYEDSEGEGDRAPGDSEVLSTDVQDAERALRTLGYIGSSGGGSQGEGTGGAGESSPEIHNNLGRIHLRNGELEKARSEFESALALDPENADGLLNLASIDRAEGKTAAAEQRIQLALQSDPNSLSALSQLAELERDRGNLDDAIRLFEEALAIDKGQPFLQLGYGDVLQRAGRFAAAEQAFQRVLELDPDSFKARYNLGVTFGNQDRIEEAIAAYSEALELDPDNPEAGKVHNNLGAIYLAKGDIDQAGDRFRSATKRDPGNLEAHYNLSLIEIDRGNVDEAVELLEHAASLAPNHAMVNLQLGWAYLRQGSADASFKSLLLVHRLEPDLWRAALGIAVLQAGAGNQEQAKTFLEHALNRGGSVARREAATFPVLEGFL